MNEQTLTHTCPLCQCKVGRQDDINLLKELEEIKSLLTSSSTPIKSRYLSAKQVEQEYGINSKTLLNRSNLPADHHRHIPSVRLGAGGKKMFERKVLDRMLSTN